MGYDIYSVDTNVEAAEAFARSNPQESVCIKQDTDEYIGGPQVYFRANIWAMNLIRYIHAAIGRGVEDLNEHLIWNDGQHVAPAQIKKTLKEIDRLTAPEIARAVMLALLAEKDLLPVDRELTIYEDGDEIEEMAAKHIELSNAENLASYFLYWTKYLDTTKNLGGFLVW